MKKRNNVDLCQWNLEAGVILALQLLGFPHMTLCSVSETFIGTFAVHMAVVGAWTLSYLWRAGERRATKEVE
jgi:hypothetical protein